MKLLPCLLDILMQWRGAFVDYRTHKRAVAFALAFLVCLGRRTISRAICAQQRQFQSWASDYRLFSESRWNSDSLFDVVLDEAQSLMWDKQPLTVAVDDTICRKTGHRIPWAKTLRDPLSPPFNTNLVWALRFLHAALLVWPAEANGAARAIPICFKLAPPVAKPSKKDGKEQWRAYRRKQRQEGLSAQGAQLLNKLRSRFDQRTGLRDRILWAVVDGSYCNRTVLCNLHKRIVIVGRTRKDIRLYGLPEPTHGKGRKRRYGDALCTPEALRKDESVPWQLQDIFATGKKHSLRYKSMAPVLWRSGARDHPMRLIVVSPLRYRAHGHILYRAPAYLLVSDLEVDVAQALQAYFYRWEIEADQKEEKDLLGVGQAQVWSEKAVPRQPAFHVASYAALLVSAVKAYGMNNTDAVGPLPHWRKNEPPTRLSAAQLISRLRYELELCDATPERKYLRRRPDAELQFQADALEQQIGMKLPVTMRAVLDSAWT
jgi:hypothetical protein